MRAGSWFDHKYPLQNIFGINKVVQYTGEELDLPYRSHSGYDYNRQNGVEYHTSVLAAASGTATLKLASNSAGAGNIIKIDHPNGYQTWYEHLDPTGMIVPDENTKVSVEKGQKIGETGFTGNVYPPNQDGAHIHLSVFKDINNNGNFEDDYPFGLNDPLGWDGKYTDPWTQWSSDPPKKIDKRYGTKSYKLFLSLKNPKEAPIATSGGELIDDKIKVSVPSDASFVPFILTLKYGPFESDDLLKSILPSFFLSAINNLGENISPFILPIQIIYDYAGANLFNIKEETLKLYHFNENTKEWDDLPSTIDTENKKIIASTMSFSHFALMGEVKDKIPPNTQTVINGTKGESNWYRSKVTVNLNGEDNAGGLGLKHTLYTVDGDNWIEYGSPLTFNEDETYAITYESSDNAYNIEDLKTATFNIDRTPPVSAATITEGKMGQNDWYTTDVKVELSANDQNGSGVEKTEYSLNSSNFSTYTPPLLITSEGENELKFRSVDKTGNIEKPKILKIKIDKTPPDTLLSLSWTKGANYWYGSDVFVSFNATDSTSGSPITFYKLDNENNFAEYLDTIKIEKEGTTTITYYSTDEAGNKENQKFKVIKIDLTPPEAEILYELTAFNTMVIGKDSSGPTTIRINKTAPLHPNYIITDQAGNTLLLNTDKIKLGKQVALSINNLQYNTNPIKTLDKNVFFTLVLTNKNNIPQQIDQYYSLKNDKKIFTNYSSSSNLTKIYTKNPGSTTYTHEDKRGIALLHLITENGNLKYSY